MDFRKMTVYQIYPKSFADSNGDGLGDLKGITSKLDYIENLGADCIWLTPIYLSPQKDNGYDVADYCSIDPRYGTMEDFDNLVSECKKRGIIIMLDMVFNHTSSEHKWFQKAIAGDKKYRDYYFFAEGKADGSPPTNWISKFGGNAWEKLGNEYYLHLFDVTQPDLNWGNPNVRGEIVDIMNFWLDKGIRGFRFDVINLVSKPDVFEDDHQGDGLRLYTDGPRIHEYLKELNRETFGKYECVTVGEMSSTTIENCILYSNPNEKELSMVFNFHHLKVDYKDGDKWSDMPYDFKMLRDLLHTWQTEMEKGGGYQAVFWCNHDQPRVVSRFGNDSEYRVLSAKMLATAVHLMRGTPYIYQGEEIGMTNAGFTEMSEYRDVESINYARILSSSGKTDKEILEILSNKSRDNARTPMQWSAEENTGFSTGEPWIPCGKNYREINVKQALADKDSIFYHYKKLIELRRHSDIVSNGSYTPMFRDVHGVFSYKRTLGSEQIHVVCNFFDQEMNIDISEANVSSPDMMISNYPDMLLDNKTLTLRPFEALAFMSVHSIPS